VIREMATMAPAEARRVAEAMELVCSMMVGESQTLTSPLGDGERGRQS